MLTNRKLISHTRRGDTIIEVMFAIAVFCLVAVISIAMMNSGVATAEASLEIVTTRNEINAQAEALRFIHSSYSSELGLSPAEQQYLGVWNEIKGNALSPSEFTLSYPPNTCGELYDTSLGQSPLARNKAFIINTRDLTSRGSDGNIDVNNIYISSIGGGADKFEQSPLNARIVYSGSNSTQTNEDELSELNNTRDVFNHVFKVQGMWVIAVKDPDDRYYDFYIQTCWYDPNSKNPTAIDTVIRLYNPEGVI